VPLYAVPSLAPDTDPLAVGVFVARWLDTDNITLDNYRLLSVALWLICLVYIWELTYRMDVGLPLFVHHMSILLMCQLIILTLYDTTTVFYARLATIIVRSRCDGAWAHAFHGSN